MKYGHCSLSLLESLEPRQLLSADLTQLLDKDKQPITGTFPSPFISTSFNAKINFQPSSVSNSKLPAGYVADNGKKYGSRGNGLTYGWSSDDTAGMKVRNSSKSTDIRYDTLAQFTSSKKWEIKVPNGTYYVRYTTGDPNNKAVAIAQIDVEKRLSLREHIRAQNYWIERGIYVNVTDGKLTISTPSTSTQWLNWVEVTGQKNPPPAPVHMDWQRTSMKAPIGRIESESVQLGNKLYILGGFTDDYKAVTNHVDMFDLETETWTPLADLPETQTHQAVTTDGRFIYVMGGQVGTRFNNLGWHGTTNSYKYDTQTNTWSTFIAAPAIWFAPMCQFIDNKIYVFAGSGPNRNDPVNTTWVLDLNQANPVWTKKAPMPVPQDHGSSVFMNGKVYFIGGEHDHSTWHAEHDYTFSYDVKADKWARLANVPQQGSHFEDSVFVYQGRIFALGGAGDGQVPLWRVSAYNPATDTWTQYSHSPIGRLGATVGLLGNKIYYIGGDELIPNNHTIDGTSIDIGFLPKTIPGSSLATKTSLFSNQSVSDKPSDVLS
jgi:N-acetylneuraminic acid mutarotase